jgi:cell wall-associated NlpC family hydrolase
MKWFGIAFGGMIAVGALAAAREGPTSEQEYRSPYSVKFNYPIKELLADIERAPRGDLREQSSVPFRDWYSAHTRKRYGAWGPPARHYSAPSGVAEKPMAWHRERAIAVGLRFVGYGYQHHHVPDWDPPRGWPWKETAVGHNGKGVDCSNFAAFVYNQGFGIKPSSGIKTLAEELEMPGPGAGRHTKAKRVELPASYAKRVKRLRTGDLLFIRNKREEISHVVLWVGTIGHSPDDTPLILDSHGEGVRDSAGKTIPAGIHLRPFHEKSWYNHSASHATRIFHTK